MSGGRQLETIAFSRRNVLGGLALGTVGLAGLTACAGEGQELSLAIWRDYLGETTLDDFRKATGITVKLTTYADNAELYARLNEDQQRFDVIVPSSHWVERMVRENLLASLSPLRLPNLANLEAPFADLPYDPGNAHSVPYTWLALGIGYRKSRVNPAPDSWKLLFDSADYAGKIALLSEAGDVIRLGAKYLGHSVNEITPEIIAEVEAMLKKQKGNVKAFHEDNGQDLLLSGEVDVVLEYNGDIAQKMTEDDDIDFVVPKEGSHYDLPIALGILATMDIIPKSALDGWAAMGELSLDGVLERDFDMIDRFIARHHIDVTVAPVAGLLLTRVDPRITVTDQSDGSISVSGLNNRYNNIVFAEDEDGLPEGWPTHAQERHGFPRGSNTVSLFFATGANNIIRRGAKLVDELVIGVTTNAAKSPMFSDDERIAMVEREVASIGDATIRVVGFNSLLMDFADAMGASVVIRGIRGVTDFEYEYQLTGMNRQLNHDVETVFLMADVALQPIASRLVKEIAVYGGNIAKFVSPAVKDDVVARIAKP